MDKLPLDLQELSMHQTHQFFGMKQIEITRVPGGFIYMILTDEYMPDGGMMKQRDTVFVPWPPVSITVNTPDIIGPL